MNGLGGLNKSPNGVVIGLVQLALPVVATPDQLAGPGGVEVETAAGVQVFAGAGREEAPRIVAELVAAGERVYRVDVRHSSLEDVYLETVGGQTG